MSQVVAVFGTLRFPPEEIQGVLPHLKELIEATYANDGCIAYDVGEDVLDPGLLRFSELWPDQESLKQHLLAPHIAPWREAARKHGLVSRQFIAYSATESWEV